MLHLDTPYRFVNSPIFEAPDKYPEQIARIRHRA
jgi:hypothetical protein